jgi:hypothetical protein
MAVMAGLAATYPRFGYRRINVFMERLGHVMGADKATDRFFHICSRSFGQDNS